MGNAFSGGALSAIAELRPPAPKWTPKNMPDLTGKVVVVTGGNAGLGKETTKALLEHNAKVYLAARSQEKAEVAIRDLQQSTGKEAIFLQLDLSNLASVRTAAEEFLSNESELHILFNNAGIWIPPIDQVTSDGFDAQWGTNVVGHWLLTKLLIPALLIGAKNSSDGKARIVTTSSSYAYIWKKLKYDSFKDGPVRRRMSRADLYSQSKFGNIVVAKELARRYGDQGIVSISLNPGNLATDAQKNVSALQQKIMKLLILYPAELGAITQLWAGTAPETAAMNGKWLIPWARVGTPNKMTQDEDTGRKLWEWLEANT